LAAWAIIHKELLILARDRRAVAVLLFMPILFIAILGLSTGKLLGQNAQNALLKLAFVDEANDDASTDRKSVV